MILELRKTCLEAIQRALININQMRTQWHSHLPKPAQQKLHSIQNDIQLLKDNFTLIATKVLRLQSKCSEKETLAQKAEIKYRSKYQQICEAHKILEVKYEKLGKQLNFIKFSNNSLRKQLQTLQGKQNLNDKLKKGIKEIQMLVLNNGQNLQIKINNIISTIQCQNQYPEFDIDQSFDFKAIHINFDKQKQTEDKIQSIRQFSLQKPLIKQETALKQQKIIMNSCELKSDRESLKTKKKPILNRDGVQFKQSLSTDKKKRNQLAKLVQQQGRLARINERYLSTDIF